MSLENIIQNKSVEVRQALCDAVDMAYVTIYDLIRNENCNHIKFACGEQNYIRRLYNVTHYEYNQLYKLAKDGNDRNFKDLLYLTLGCEDYLEVENN